MVILPIDHGDLEGGIGQPRRIVPGGNFIDMSARLTPRTTARVRDAVQHGLMDTLGPVDL